MTRKQQKLVSPHSGSGKSEIRALAWLARTLGWAADLSLHPCPAERARGLCGVSSARTLILSSLLLNQGPKDPPPNTITLAMKVSGDTNIQAKAMILFKSMGNAR